MIFRCKGCGSHDSIVEITLIPSIQTVRPDPAPNHVPFEDVDYTASDYVNFYEGAPVLGFGCRNEKCTFWQGDYGYPSREPQINARGWFIEFDMPPALKDIAEEVDE